MNEEIKRTDAISLVQGLEDSDGLRKSFLENKLEQDSTDAYLRAREYADLIEMRGMWSKGIALLLAFIVVTDTAFVWALGLGLLNFSSGIVVPTFVGESIIKTIGLAFVIVRFLFNKDSLKKEHEKI